ncbi:MAG TPA: dehydrogenase [Actinobacteria bacterium]|jgi:3-oxoacyl-[acyl-carrier protein] reductase|nr:dehydrogenase [Actinomycetota bacterium]
MNSFADRVVIVTGGSQGIGRAYVEAFVRDGAKVAIFDLSNPEQTANEISSDGDRVIGIRVDVTDRSQVQEAFDRTVRQFGHVDVLVNNAAFYEGLTFQPFDRITDQDWDRSMNVNVKGVWLMCSIAAPHMRERNYGRIINISSNVVFMGKTNFLHYVTSKGAVWALTNAMSREFAGTAITVNCVAPGYTITPATRNMSSPEEVAELERQILAAQSIRRLLEAEDMVGAVQYLASDSAAMVTGQTITVDGGVIVG